MSFYDGQGWPNAARQHSWDHQHPPLSQSNASSVVQRDESTAFTSQLEEVERAMENLIKSGKMFPIPGRRDSMPTMGSRPFPDFDPRMAPSTMQRHHSLSEFDPMRPHSASNLQGYYANQRYQPRASEAEQMLQQKRRMAAQRERELRNYHQEQQYNRSLLADMGTHGKPDRTVSPAMSEEERRELIARQHRALYGKDSGPYSAENGVFGNESNTPRPTVQGSSSAASTNPGIRGPSPLSYDPFGANKNQVPASLQGQKAGGTAEHGGQLTSESHQGQPSSGSGPSPTQPQQRSRANSTSSPASNPNSFSLFENGTQQSSRTSTSSPGGSPPRQGSKATSGVGPIGTRPSPSVQAQAANPALNKRSTTPLPSPLSYGFSHQEDTGAKERSTSSASNPSGPTGGAQEQNVSSIGWGSKSGVWGSKSSLGVQASVWG